MIEVGLIPQEILECLEIIYGKKKTTQRTGGSCIFNFLSKNYQNFNCSYRMLNQISKNKDIKNVEKFLKIKDQNLTLFLKNNDVVIVWNISD